MLNSRLVRYVAAAVAAGLLVTACSSPTPPAAPTRVAPAAVPSSPPGVPSTAASPVASLAAASPSIASSPPAVPSPSPSGQALSTSGPLETVTVAYPTKGPAFAFLWVGKDLGIYQKYGIDMEPQQISPASSMAALLTGELDFAATIGSASRAALRGLPVRVVLVALNASDFTLLGAKNVTSVNQLKGAVISTDAPGTTSNEVATELLRRHGLNPDDYTVVPSGDDASRTAVLQSGQAQAVIVEDSTALPLIRQGYQQLATSAEIALPYSGLAAGQSSLQSKRDLLGRTVQATLEAVRTAHDDPARAVPIWVQEFGLSTDDATAMLQDFQSVWAVDGQPTQDAMSYELSNDQRDMSLPSAPTPDQIYDFSLLG